MGAVEPIKLRFTFLNENFLGKVKAFKDHLLTDRLKNLVRSDVNFLQDNIPQRIFKYNSYPFKNVVKNQIQMQSVINVSIKDKMRKKSEMSNMEMKTIFLEATSSIEPGMSRIFTDGTKSLESAGGAMFNETNQISIKFKLFENGSIFAAEATAILEALNHVIMHNLISSVTFTDSLSVIMAMQNDDI